MNDFITFFRGSSPYINAHRGKIFVLAISGEAISHANFTHIVHDIALLHHLGIKLVLVHGARPQIESRMTACNLASQFDKNRRVTDNETLSCVKDAVGSTRSHIESMLSIGLANSPMEGARIKVASGNTVTAKPLGVRDGTDFHHTGEVRRIDRDAILQWLDSNSIALISPLGYSPSGETFNLCFDEVATQVAISLQAEKLMIFSDQSGVADNEGHLQKIIPHDQVQNFITMAEQPTSNVAALEACYQACLNGVSRGHIISYLDDGALLKELFTLEGSGTLITQQSTLSIRPATIEDIGGLLELMTPLEDAGTLVKRSRERIETEISKFFVIEHSEKNLVACAALYPFQDSDAAEFACVITQADFQGKGLAKLLLDAVTEKAKKQQITELFVLTTHTAHWFRENGFQRVDLSELPVEKQACYNYQRNSTILKKTL